MNANINVLIQMRGPSIIQNGILSIGFKTVVSNDKENIQYKRISFKPGKTRLYRQDWDAKYKLKWGATSDSRNALLKIDMESYDSENACKKIKEYFVELLNKYEKINITVHPEDIGLLSSYFDFYLNEYGFFQK